MSVFDLQRATTRRFRGALAAAGLAALLAGAAAGQARAALTFMPVARYPLPGKLAASRSVVALAQIDGAQASLLVAVGDGAPVPASVGPLPAWAQPHVGTSSSGASVVVYPRCAAGVATCDLYAYYPVAKRERRIAGASSQQRGEIEGSMSRGALAFTRWTRATEPDPGAARTADRMDHVQTRLMYRPVGGPNRVVTSHGAHRIGLQGTRILQVRDVNPAAPECGTPTLEAVDLRGVARRVRAFGCGMEAHTPVGVGWASGKPVWLLNSVDRPAFSVWDEQHGRILTHRFRLRVVGFPTSLTSYAPRTASVAMLLLADYSNSAVTYQLERAAGIAPTVGG